MSRSGARVPGVRGSNSTQADQVVCKNYSSTVYCSATLIGSHLLFPCVATITAQKKATIHQVTTMLAISKYLLFPGHSHLLTTGTDELTLIITKVPAGAIIKVKGHKYRCLAGGYDLEIGHF